MPIHVTSSASHSVATPPPASTAHVRAVNNDSISTSNERNPQVLECVGHAHNTRPGGPFVTSTSWHHRGDSPLPTYRPIVRGADRKRGLDVRVAIRLTNYQYYIIPVL